MSSPGDDGSPIPLGVSLPVDDIPLALPAPQGILSSSAQTPSNPRRLPPPCWSHDETIALIDAYRDKWYVLRRGNLKANHWQEVADAVGSLCPGASPSKTAVQCRHKMEKLRKRYRTEIQRARSMPISRFSSAWVHFQRMDAMEKGSQIGAVGDNRPAFNSDSDGGEENEEDDEDEPNNLVSDQSGVFYADSFKNGAPYGQTRSAHKLYNNRNGIGGSPPVLPSSVPAGGFRIRIPSGVSIAQPAPAPPPQKVYAKANLLPPAAAPGSAPNLKVAGARGANKGDDEIWKKRERDPMEEMVAAVKLLGDGFVRMEQMKMEMARDMETMRMEMEMKRTQMILDSQQRIVEAFAKAFSDRKRAKQALPNQDLPNTKRTASPPASS